MTTPMIRAGSTLLLLRPDQLPVGSQLDEVIDLSGPDVRALVRGKVVNRLARIMGDVERPPAGRHEIDGKTGPLRHIGPVRSRVLINVMRSGNRLIPLALAGPATTPGNDNTSNEGGGHNCYRDTAHSGSIVTATRAGGAVGGPIRGQRRCPQDGGPTASGPARLAVGPLGLSDRRRASLRRHHQQAQAVAGAEDARPHGPSPSPRPEVPREAWPPPPHR